jgi:hypothetical protein
MSDDEFDDFLGLLSRLLRLGNKQRHAISRELRAHLEDRLDELLAAGVPREQAVRQALDEFGDAAGLAAEFVSISRHKRRRWQMRITTASLAAMVLVAIGIFTFWPGGNAGPGLSTVVAQVPGKNLTEDPARVEQPAVPTKMNPIREALDRRMTFKFNGEPLIKVLWHFGQQTGVTMYLDTKSPCTT